MITYRVVLNVDGINRNYVCESYFDAIVLFDVLCSSTQLYRRIEIWESSIGDNRPIRTSIYGRVD